MTHPNTARQLVQEMPSHDPVPIMITVRPDGAEKQLQKIPGSLGQRRKNLRVWQENLKRDLLAYILTQQDGQASIVNAMPGTCQLIVKAPKSWWERELLGEGKLASMPLKFMPNRQSVYLIE